LKQVEKKLFDFFSKQENKFDLDILLGYW